MPGPVVRYVLVAALLLLSASWYLTSNSHSPNYHLLRQHAGPSSVPHLRILPLGDSITYGYNDPTGNSYRYFLECLLHQTTPSHSVQYTGSIVHGNWPNSRNHGLTLHGIQQVRQNLELEFAAAATGGSYISQPNVVLTNVGACDIMANRRLETLPGLLERLIDLVHAQWPDALQVIASVIPNQDEMTDEHTRDFNAVLPDIVRNKSREGKKLLFVSMDEVRKHELIDTVHPNGTAYMKMARRWYEAIVSAEETGMITPLPKRAKGEITVQARRDAPSLHRCATVFDDIKNGVAEAGEVANEELGTNKDIDLYS